MFPDAAHFTELEVDPKNMLRCRLVRGPFDESWSRVLVPPEAVSKKQRQVCTWILDNIRGRFGMVYAEPKSVIFFEDHRDAILFKLMGAGEVSE